MNAERLLALFERISEAPDAIPRLRRFILDLAVRGKLVEQDPEDEPAELLLESIAAERLYLEKTGEIKRGKKVPDPDAPPFLLPESWRWTQLARLGILNPRNTAHDELDAAFVPMPCISAEYGISNAHEVRSWGQIKKGYTHFMEGDIGLAKITPCFENGKSTVFRGLTGGLGSGTTELHVLRPLQVSPEYILIFLKSPHFISSGIPRMTGTAGQKRIPLDYFAFSPFPLPPLAEQHRIVAKVDELMTLCDQLEDARRQREQSRERLVVASLQRLNQPREEPEAFRSDARFALQVLPSLTTTPAQIKQLRQTILNLAVRGKLVEQDPEDEPAEEQLERIIEAKILHGRKSRATKKKRNDATAEADSFQLPDGWATAPLADLVSVLNGRAYKQSELLDVGTPVLRVGNLFTSNKWYYSDLELEDDKYCNEGDLIFAWSASFGPFIWSGGRVIYHYHIWKLPLHSPADLSRDYLYLYLLNKTAEIKAAGHGISMIHMTKEKMEKLEVPLPPLAEQHRIVAKVDELMVFCDQLEQQLSHAEQSRRGLLEAVLRDALADSCPSLAPA
jgi:type I restriction enzyme S subunit